jgi:hypothetical protein
VERAWEREERWPQHGAAASSRERERVQGHGGRRIGG